MKGISSLRKFLSLSLAAVLMLALLPATVFAVGIPYNADEYNLESEHFIWTVEDSQNQSGMDGSAPLGWEVLLNNISPGNFNKWFENLDKAYEAYAALVGGTPAHGLKIKLVKNTTIAGAYAFVMGTDYVFWNQQAVAGALQDIENSNGVECNRAILHEIGHLFDIGSWAFNPECFANLKLYYVMEKAGLKASTTDGQLMGGREQWDYYYGSAKADFARDPNTLKIFDSDATAEPPLVAIGAILEGLGGWSSSDGPTGFQGWDVFHQVFASYTDPDYKVTGYYGAVNGRDYNTVREFLRRLSYFAGTDATQYIPEEVKTQITSRYFPLDSASGWLPYVVEYQSPTGILGNDSNGGITLSFDRAAVPEAGKTLQVSVFNSALQYDRAGNVYPYLYGNGYYPFSYTFTGNETLEEQGDATYRLTIPFSGIRYGGGSLSISDVLNNNGGIGSQGKALCVVLDKGAFSYDGGVTTGRDWGAAFFRRAYATPAILSSSPADKAVNVPETGTLEIVFSTQMDKGRGRVLLNESEIPGTWSSDGRIYTAAYAGLSRDTVYTARLTGFADPYGNALPASGVSFTPGAEFLSTGVSIDMSDLTADQINVSWSYDEASKTLLLNGGADVSLSGTAADGRHIVVNDNAGDITIALNGLSITTETQTALNLGQGNTVNIRLEKGSENTLSALGNDTSGLRLGGNTSLRLTGEGELTARSGPSWPGIGGNGNGRSVVVESGSIASYGGSNAAGIGGSWGSDGGTITVNGGTVYARSGGRGAGIGGGRGGTSGGTITINGGSVTAVGVDSGAGIGGSAEGAAGNVVINGGRISAISGVETGGDWGPAIGCGFDAQSQSNPNSITINGGTITAANYKNNSVVPVIGGRNDAHYLQPTLTINGGSLRLERMEPANMASRIFAQGGIKNAAGQTLGLTAFSLGGSPGGGPGSITAGKIGGVDCSGILSSDGSAPLGYGVYDVETLEYGGLPTVFFWLPDAETAEAVSLEAGGNAYLGSFARPAAGNQAQLAINAWEVGLSETGTLDFGTRQYGYSPVTPETVTVTNRGNMETGALRVTLTGTDAGSFRLAGAQQESSTGVSGLLLDSIPVGGEASFTVEPKAGLAPKSGAYSVAAAVSGSHNISAGFSARFQVTTAQSTVKVTEKPTALTYGDSCVIKAAILPAPTGSDRGTAALYRGETPISENIAVGADGTAALDLDTADKKLALGENTLHVRFSGSGTQEASNSVNFTVSMSARQLTASAAPSKTYDGTAVFTDISLTLSKVVEGDKVAGKISGHSADANAGNPGFTIDTINLTGQDAAWYALSGDAVSAPKATISQKALKDSMIQAIPTQIHTGLSIKPQLLVKDGDLDLTAGKDYTAEYGQNIQPGPTGGTVVITGKGNYTGTARATFSIRAKDTRITAVEVQNGEVTAKIFCDATETGANAYCAAYDGNGRMVAVSAAQLTAGRENTCKFVVSEQNVSNIAIFVLNSKFVPACGKEDVRLP